MIINRLRVKQKFLYFILFISLEFISIGLEMSKHCKYDAPPSNMEGGGNQVA
jgi:hypothetical protein